MDLIPKGVKYIPLYKKRKIMDEKIDIQRLKAIQTEKKKLMRYISRSQKTIAKNIKALKKLDREQEILLNLPLPGL